MVPATSPYASLMRLTLRAGFAAFVAGMLALVACSSDTKSATTRPLSIDIIMNVHADPASVTRVGSLLRHSPDVLRTDFVSHAMAYRWFSCWFRDQPLIVSTTNAADLPESFRVTVERRIDAERLRRRFSAIPGVDSVEVPLTHQQQQYLLREIGLPRAPSNAAASRC